MDTRNVIHLHDRDAAVKFSQSLHEKKFALIKSDLFSSEDLATFYEEWRTFFRSDIKKKHHYLFDEVKEHGYFPVNLERARIAKETGYKEAYHYIPTGNNPSSTQESSYKIYITLLLITQTILQWLDISAPEEITSNFPLPLSSSIDIQLHTLLRVLYHPANDAETTNVIRTIEHQDRSLLTLLPLATAPGLEIKNSRGEWVSVEGREDSVLVISGHLLEIYSQGYYQPIIHRVINSRDNIRAGERLSSVLFVHPKPDIALPNGLSVIGFFHEREKIKQLQIYNDTKAGEGKREASEFAIGKTV